MTEASDAIFLSISRRRERKFLHNSLLRAIEDSFKILQTLSLCPELGPLPIFKMITNKRDWDHITRLELIKDHSQSRNEASLLELQGCVEEGELSE